MREISGIEEWNSIVMNHEGWCVIDFWGPTCAPCVTMTKHLAAAETQLSKLDFYSVNAEIEIDTAVEAGVRGLPTTLIYQGGTEVIRWIGLKNTRWIVDELQKLAESR